MIGIKKSCSYMPLDIVTIRHYFEQPCIIDQRHNYLKRMMRNRERSVQWFTSAGAYLGGVLRVLEHPPQLGMHKIKYSLNYKHALGTYLIHPCITSLTAKFTKLEH